MSPHDGRKDEVNPSTPAPDGDEEKVAPRRAAQRLYDEMALAYHEQADLDREIAAAFFPVSVESLRHEEE